MVVKEGKEERNCPGLSQVGMELEQLEEGGGRVLQAEQHRAVVGRGVRLGGGESRLIPTRTKAS